MNDITFRPELKPATIEADFDGMRERLDAQLRMFDGLTPEAAAALDPSVQKACRAELSKMRKELDDARKAVKRDYNKPLAEFEAEVKGLIAMIDGPRDVIDRAIKDREAAEREGRYRELEQVWEEFAPMLAGLVPFSKACRDEWLNKTGWAKRPDEVRAAAERIASELDSLRGMGLAFPDEAERHYLDTLDLVGTVRRDARQREEADRLAAVRARQEALRAPEAPSEAVKQPEAPEARREGRRAVIRAYAFECDMTEEQRDELVAWLKARGIRGSFKVRRVA